MCALCCEFLCDACACVLVLCMHDKVPHTYQSSPLHTTSPTQTDSTNTPALSAPATALQGLFRNPATTATPHTAQPNFNAQNAASTRYGNATAPSNSRGTEGTGNGSVGNEHARNSGRGAGNVSTGGNGSGATTQPASRSNQQLGHASSTSNVNAAAAARQSAAAAALAAIHWPPPLVIPPWLEERHTVPNAFKCV